MNDPSGLTSSRISDDGAQRLIEGNSGVNLGQPYGRARWDLSFSSLKGTQCKTREKLNFSEKWQNDKLSQ